MHAIPGKICIKVRAMPAKAENTRSRVALRGGAAAISAFREALGVYNDKRSTTEVAKQFAYMLSYSKALPESVSNLQNALTNIKSALER